MTNETSAEAMSPARRGLSAVWAVVKALLLVALLLTALVVWFPIVYGGLISKFVVAVLIVVIASMAWQQIRGS